jgi:acyl-CoA reductase-like NAD-dependent aldehyde dehydrogenase
MGNKFENPFPPPEEKPEEQQQETPPEQPPEVPQEAAPAETTEQLQEGQVEQAEEEAPWTEASPEEASEKLSDFADIMEKQKEAILELRVNIAVEADEEKREKLIDNLEFLENEASQWDSDFGPATQEEDIVIKTRPHKGE